MTLSNSQLSTEATGLPGVLDSDQEQAAVAAIPAMRRLDVVFLTEAKDDLSSIALYLEGISVKTHAAPFVSNNRNTFITHQISTEGRRTIAILDITKRDNTPIKIIYTPSHKGKWQGEMTVSFDEMAMVIKVLPDLNVIAICEHIEPKEPKVPAIMAIPLSE